MKSFNQFLQESHVLLEMPMLMPIHKLVMDTNLQSTVKYTQRSKVAPGKIDFGGDLYYYHGDGANAHSISNFEPHWSGNYLVHKNTAKTSHGSAELILDNIERASKETNKPVISDSVNSVGARSLWLKLANRHPDHVHVVKSNGDGEFVKHGKLKDANVNDVWNEGANNVRVMYDKGNE
jgi:hypothetical protein